VIASGLLFEANPEPSAVLTLSARQIRTMTEKRHWHPGKKNAARPIIPGKNPKTQRDVQSSRLVLRHAQSITGADAGQSFFMGKIPERSKTPKIE
jgi:hypothetical protein